MNNLKLYLGLLLGTGLVIVFVALGIMYNKLANVKKSEELYKRNMESALTECITWRTKDSLSAAKNDVLTLKVAELEKYRAEDLAAITELKSMNEELDGLVTELSEMSMSIKTEVRDSIVYVDSTIYNAKVFDWTDNWVTVNGKLIADSVDLNITSKDSLIVGITTEYKRFLGFLWKTKKIKKQNVYATSKNPHTEITDIECINVN